jgi:hypothetical protein
LKRALDSGSVPGGCSDTTADAPLVANDNGTRTRIPSTAPMLRGVKVTAPTAEHLTAHNDNEIAVSDDLQRPLPIMRGEGNLVRTLLGDRFRQILCEGEPS